MPEYLSKRFGGQRMRIYFASLSLILYIFTKCSGDLYTGALFIQQSLQWDLYVSIVILVLLTAVLTITGGLTAVIYTDTLQAFLMIGGAVYLMVTGFQAVGGFEGLLQKYPQAVPTNESAIVPNTTCHWPDPQAFRMLRPIDDNYMPWMGFLLGQTPGSIWYWCTDQVIVQRVLAARSLSHAQGATLMAGFIKILPLFVMVMPGMISRVLYPNEVACTNPDYCYQVCQSHTGCSNIAYPRLVLGLMPDGARGLMMAVMIAALMSDLDSIFNSASTLFTMDIWRRLRKRASTVELMVVGRVFIAVMVGVSVAWVPVIKETSGGQVFIYINEVTDYLAPPFAAVFLLAVLVPMVNEKGVFFALMVALVIGLTRLAMVFAFQGSDTCSAERTEVPAILGKFHYMYFSLFITATTAILAIVISYFTGRPDPKYLHKTTFWTRHAVSECPANVLGEPNKAICNAPREVAVPLQEKGQEASYAALVVEVDTDDKVKMSNVDGYRNCDVLQDGHHTPTAADVNVITGHKEFDVKRSKTLKNVCFGIICGIHLTSDSAEEQLASMKEHLSKLEGLEQSRQAKCLLTLGLAAITITGVAMYIFWSVFQFNTAPFYPLNGSSILGSDNATFLD